MCEEISMCTDLNQTNTELFLQKHKWSYFWCCSCTVQLPGVTVWVKLKSPHSKRGCCLKTARLHLFMLKSLNKWGMSLKDKQTFVWWERNCMWIENTWSSWYVESLTFMVPSTWKHCEQKAGNVGWRFQKHQNKNQWHGFIKNCEEMETSKTIWIKI